MKKILGLDLGTSSIGWAMVNESEYGDEKPSIIRLGVRVNPLTTDELMSFDKGKSITTNADRTLKRSMRRNLHRFKLRRENLIMIMKENGFIDDETILTENGNGSTFETYKLRAKAVSEEITMQQLARVLLMINKKRGYKSSRKAKNEDEGQLIDGMSIAKRLYEENITPGELVLRILKNGKKYIPDFYRSDLQAEFDKIWEIQKQFHSEILTDDLKAQLRGKGKLNSAKIFLGKFGIYTADNKGADKRLQTYQWRVDALKEELTKEQLAFVISDLNGIISNSSGYLGSISDRSKELYFQKITVGQCLMDMLSKDPQCSLKNIVFYRQDYLDEFNIIWEKQATFHRELTPELKAEIRDVIIFYQRRLKSQKGLISFCEFESRQIEIESEGKRRIKTVGSKVCPRSSPLFQEFKIWQNLNNIQVIDKTSNISRFLEQDEKELLFSELNVKNKVSKKDVLGLLFGHKNDLDLNFKEIEGNRTQATLLEACRNIIEISGHGEYDFNSMSSSEILSTIVPIFDTLKYNTDILFFDSSIEGKAFEKQVSYKLWHLLYSFEGDDSKTGNEKLLNKISQLYGFDRESSSLISNIYLQPDYGSISAKAIRRILPHMKEGFAYGGRKERPDEPSACEYAGYRHSRNSLTKEENENKLLKNKLDILPKNTLRNPVVEKILNQMINVVNAVVDNYGKPDEIRIELARDLKKSAKERAELTASIGKTTSENEEFRIIIQKEFGLTNVSRNDLIRYKLYLELESRGFKTIYSNTYIPKDKIFSKEYDIEHIIPQSRLFDDSFSNKTLESRSVNIEKGNDTAYDYILKKHGNDGLADYLDSLEDLLRAGKITRTKYNKLKMKGDDIPDNFIARDLRDTQYIAKKAKTILEEIARNVVSTTGSITYRLREDWQLIDVLQELNWEKYNVLGMTEIIDDKDGHKIRRIKDWTKRNDHRHHAMDALTIAFTKASYVQYLNNLNARSDKSGSIYGIEVKELYRDDKGKLKFKPPLPLNDFRSEAKRHLENTLISIKAKNKVVTLNKNVIRKGLTKMTRTELTPRGQLHLETVYGSQNKYVVKYEKVGSGFNEEQISKVANRKYREALVDRLKKFGNDPTKAFTGINSLRKNPIFLDKSNTLSVPEKVKTVWTEKVYTIRKEISPDLKIDKVVDARIRALLKARLDEYKGDNKKAFSGLNENPIWLNKKKGIRIKRVTLTGISNAIALHDKRTKDGNLIPDKEGKPQAVDYVNTGNNHHVAIYEDENGNLQENVVSFFEAVARKHSGLPVIDKEYRKSEGWKFLFSMKQNEYFVFPNENTGFNPKEIDLLDPENYKLISPNLFRVQKFSKVLYGNTAVRDYVFRHHLETMIKDDRVLKGISYKSIKSLLIFNNVVKIRINHIGNIISVGEY
jgi:CRISPR-associated endonuclease Csn1